MGEPVTLYWLPHCTTCRKADAHLGELGVRPAAYRDLKAEPLARAEVERLSALVGGPSALFSRRALKYRAWGLGGRELADDELVELMTREYTFIRRPVLVRGGRALAGYTAKSYERFFGES